MKIIFAGTTGFAAHHLELVHASKHQIPLVLTQPDRKSGRGRKIKHSPVKIYSQDNSLEILQPNSLINSTELESKIKTSGADLLLVVAYGQIIPGQILKATKHGAINVHASLLPLWRGASPIEHMIMSGDSKGGLTFMKMDEGLDTGPILELYDCKIDQKETRSSLEEKLKKISSSNFLSFLDRFEEGKIIEKEQDHSLSSYAKKIKKEDRKISCDRMEAVQVDRKIRALSEEHSCYIEYKGKKLILLSALPSKLPMSLRAGEILADNGRLFLGCMNKSFLEIITLQIPGKSPVSSSSFISGYKSLLET